MPVGQVIGQDGKAHLVNIAGDKPTPEEQAQIDSIAYGTGPTLMGAAEAQSSASQLRGEARTLERDLRSDAADTRNKMSLLTGLAGGLLGTAVAPGIGTAIGAAAGSALGPLAGTREPAGRAAEKAGFGPTQDELTREMLMQGGTSLAFDTAGAMLGKVGKGILGLGNRAEIIQEIDDAAKVGIRTTAGDLGRPWLQGYRKVASIIPILGAPFRAAESNRAREIAAGIQGLRGPLDPLVGEAEMSAELLRAAANNAKSAKPWYKMFYTEAENHAKASGTQFNVGSAVAKAEEYANLVERGRKVINRTSGRTSETISQRTTEFERAQRVSESSRSAEGTIATSGGQQPGITPVGPETREFSAAPNEMGLATSSQGISTTTARTVAKTVKRESSLSRAYNDSADVSALLDDFRHYNPEFDFYQYDSTMKELDSAWKAASDTQKVAILQIRGEMEKAALATGDERFNFLYNNARGNFKTFKEFFGNPQAKKFRLTDDDVFDTGFNSGRTKEETKEVSSLFKTIFTPELGPDGVANIAKMVQPQTMDRAVRMNIRQRVDAALLNPEGPKWSALHQDLGLNDPSSLRYQTFEAMLKNSNYGIDAAEFKKRLMTLESYVGEQLPALSTQLIRSISIGNTGSALRNLSGARAFDTGGMLQNMFGKVLGALVSKGLAVGAVTQARTLSNFISDPDRFRVMMQYIDEAQVPIPGSALPGTKFGMPAPGMGSEVGSGARQTYLSVKKPTVRLLEKKMMQYLAIDIANKVSNTAAEVQYKTKEIYDQIEYGYNHPDEIQEDAKGLAETGIEKAKTMFDKYLPQRTTK